MFLLLCLLGLFLCLFLWVEEEPQQIQISVTNVSTQKKVVPQAAVEILDNRTGSGRGGHDFANALFYGVELVTKSFSQSALALPVGWQISIESLQLADGMHKWKRYVQPCGEFVEPLIQHAGEG